MAAKYLILVLIVDFCSLVYCHSDNVAFQPLHPSDSKFDTSSFAASAPFSHTFPENTEEDVPIILWWTDRLSPEKHLKQLTCPSTVCYSTSDRKYLKDPRTYGFYFYGTDLNAEDMPFPRLPHHEWALYHEESPMNNYILVHDTMLKLFNHTATFRRESDYPITSISLLSAEYILDRKPVSIQEKNEARKQGFAPVLFAQSHCNIASDRERYIKELMKYIEVDSVGSCLHNKDIPDDLRDPVESMEAPLFHDLIAKYKFHIAFENAICKDYMTEKLFRPLHVGSVPVCRGSSLARDWMPDNRSIIMADDFSSPQELAQFLKHLDENDQEYEKYLEYKKHGIQNANLFKHLREREWGVNDRDKPDSLIGFECHICQKISERYAVEKMHRSDPSIPLLPPHTASANHMSCPQPHPSVGSISDIPKDDKWRDEFWIEDYWGALDKAKALAKMIENKEKNSRVFMKYWDDITNEQYP